MRENVNEELYISKKFIIINNNDEKYEIRSIMGDKKYRINQQAYEIIESIQNKKNDIYNNDEKIFITKLLNTGVLTKEKKLSGNHSIKKVERNNGLDRIFLEITHKCNLYCKHCYNSSSMESEEGELTTLEIKELIRKADQMGVWQFDITGGEPWLRKDLFEILAYAQEHGMITTLFTNLTLMSEQDVECLKKLNVKKIVTSLDAYSRERHDDFRGKRGAFAKTTSNIKLLKQYDVPITVNTVVGKHNISELNDLIDYLNLELEVPYVVDVIMPVGRGKISDAEDAYFEILPYLRSICGMKERCMLNHKRNISGLENSFCGVGNSLMYISCNGNVNLCPSLNYRVNKKFFFGNIRETDLKEIWNSIRSQYGDIVGVECKQCDKFVFCKGGCRSKAYHMSGDINGKDIVACKTFKDEKNV